MRLNTDEMGTGAKIAVILVVCCVGVLIIGLVGNMMSPDQNTNTAPATTTSSADNSTSSANPSTSTNTSTDNSQQVYTSGTYKVGQDLPAGEYKFTQTDEYGGYIERSSDSSMEFDSIISNEATSDKGETAYVTVHDGEYLKIDGGEIVKDSSN